MCFSVLCLLCLCARLFICALWSISTMLWLFEGCTISTPQIENLAALKLEEKLALIAKMTWLLSLVCLLKRNLTGFPGYTGYLNVIKDQINQALLIMLVCVLLLSCLISKRSSIITKEWAIT